MQTEEYLSLVSTRLGSVVDDDALRKIQGRVRDQVYSGPVVALPGDSAVAALELVATRLDATRTDLGRPLASQEALAVLDELCPIWPFC